MSPEKKVIQNKVTEIRALPGEIIIITIPSIDPTGVKQEKTIELTEEEARAIYQVGALVTNYGDTHLQYVHSSKEHLDDVEPFFISPVKALYDSSKNRGADPEEIFSNVRTFIDKVVIPGAADRDIQPGMRLTLCRNTDMIVRDLFTRFGEEESLILQDKKSSPTAT